MKYSCLPFKFPGAVCEITGVLQGLTEGKHGLHILEYGDISQGLHSNYHSLTGMVITGTAFMCHLRGRIQLPFMNTGKDIFLTLVFLCQSVN